VCLAEGNTTIKSYEKYKKIIHTSLGIVGFVCFCTSAVAAEKKTVLATLATESSVLARQGTELKMELRAEELKRIQEVATSFQWRKDGKDIQGATNAVMVFSAIDFGDVASYTLAYWGAKGGESAPVHVSVFQEATTNPTIGAVSYPLGAFGTPPPGGNVICGKTFDKWKAFEPFDGPNVSPASPSYPNPNNHTKLTIDTCASGNGPTLDTGIQIVGNWAPPPTWCNDNATCSGLSNPLLSSRTITMQSGKTYRVGIYWKSGTQGNITTVTFNYTYFD
jgi:hypothetical protein